MKKTTGIFLLIFIGAGGIRSFGQGTPAAGNEAVRQMGIDKENLKVVIIRHAEKPLTGDNLTCQGVARSLQLPAVLYAKFGVPAYTYIPAPGLGESTKHARMLQTVTPFAAKYNLVLDSKFEEFDSTNIARDLLAKTGTVLMVWQHHAIASIARSLGVKVSDLVWDDRDFDSIWIVTFPKGVATLTKDKEGLKPAAACAY